MWLLLQPFSTPLKEKSLAYSMNMPTLGRDHPFIHQVNLNGLRPMLMKNLSKLVVTNISLLWMDILSLSSSRMVWPMPPPLENPQIRTWTHIHMNSSPLLMNGTPESLTMILHTLMDCTTVKSLTNLLVTPCLMPIEMHGHPHPASRTLSMSPPGRGLLPRPRITSKCTLHSCC